MTVWADISRAFNFAGWNRNPQAPLTLQPPLASDIQVQEALLNLYSTAAGSALNGPWTTFNQWQREGGERHAAAGRCVGAQAVA